MTAALELVTVEKAFPGVRALKSVSMHIDPGEVIGLVGENGAGKSTLMRILSGVYQPDSGKILHDGKEVSLRGPKEAQRVGIGMVHQEQSLLLNLSIAENIYLGREERFMRRGGIVDWGRLKAAASEQLKKVQLDVDPLKRAEQLTFAQRQMVELAKVLTLEDEISGHLVVMLDEPTSVLERADVEILFSRVRALRSRAAFIFVSHRLDEILELSDRIYVMKDGEVVAEMPAKDASTRRLHELMVGRTQNAEYYRESTQEPPADTVVLEAKGLALGRSYRDVSFQLHAGEVLGIAGVLGSGREELSRTLAGLAPPEAGELRIGGKPVALTRPSDAVANGIGYVPRERRVEGIVGFLPMAANITLGSLKGVMRNGFLDHRQEKAIARSWVEKLSIRPPRIEQLAMNLSGGNQQKVVLAKWIQAGARILILDHPTRGLDVGAKEEVYALVRTLSAQGVAVILTADTLEETIGLSHRVLVMKDGSVTAEIAAPRGGKPEQIRLIEHMV